jgi:hypothetical protein
MPHAKADREVQDGTDDGPHAAPEGLRDSYKYCFYSEKEIEACAQWSIDSPAPAGVYRLEFMLKPLRSLALSCQLCFSSVLLRFGSLSINFRSLLISFRSVLCIRFKVVKDIGWILECWQKVGLFICNIKAIQPICICKMVIRG